MANKIANRKVICDTLLEAAATDKDIVVLCSDSRGSASLTPFFDQYPQQSIEVGIAEQDLVSIAAGMASCGKKAWAASPASFVTTRSYEQCKVDVSYSNTNVKLIGISGGVSYGALGMSHHSAQDIAAMSAIPNMRVYLPSDRFQTAELVRALVADNKPAYIRVGRNPVEDVYTEDECPFQMDRATWVRRGTDVTLVATGEMVRHAVDAADLLAEQGTALMEGLMQGVLGAVAGWIDPATAVSTINTYAGGADRSAAIAIIGGADGPTAIFVSGYSAQTLWGLCVKVFSNVIVVVLNYVFSKLIIFKKKK